MCGLVGAYATDTEIDRKQLQRAQETLLHRGPDGQDSWRAPQGNVALAHSRLAVIDPQGGRQPLTNEDRTLFAVVNGEFYDFERQRRELEDRGHHFRTYSDSEIALHLYEEYGLDFVAHLRGEFALILWDVRRQRLLAVRDRFGIKPLCYGQRKDQLWLASEAKALLAAGFERSWNQAAFFQAAHLHYPPPGQTLFAGIAELRPGHLLLADSQGVKIHCYWDLDYPLASKKSVLSEQEATTLVRRGLEEAVRLRLRSDVPLCVQLSGGVDSAAVLALAAQSSDRPLHAFTVCFDEQDYSEAAIAAQMAHHVGAEWHPVPVRRDQIATHLEAAVIQGEGLAINGHIVAKYVLSRAVQKAGFKVALTGEGADEVFGGYAHFKRDLLLAQDSDREALSRLAQSNAVSRGTMMPWGEGIALDGLAQKLGSVPSFLEAKATLGFRLRHLLHEDLRRRFKERDPPSALLAAFDLPGQLRGRHPLAQSSYLWTRLALSSYILRTLGDGMEMAHSVEGRVPFLDHPLFEKARNIPWCFKIKGEVEKHVLREAVPEVLPAILQRRKHPFVAPPLSTTDDALHTHLTTILSDASSCSLFSAAKVKKLLAGLQAKSHEERRAYDPVLMMVASATFLEKHYRLGAA